MSEFQVLALLATAVLLVVGLGLLWLKGSLHVAISRRLAESEGSREGQSERLERELRAAYPQLDVVPFLGDITRPDDVARAFDRTRPEIVFP